MNKSIHIGVHRTEDHQVYYSLTSMDSLAQCLQTLQLSHFLVSASKLDEGKAQCMETIKVVTGLLRDKDHDQIELIKAVAWYAGDYYEKLYKTKRSPLLVTEKMLWLASKVHGYSWYPVLTMGSITSMDIPPLAALETPLRTPDMGETFQVEFRNTALDWSTNGVGDLYQDLLPNCSFVLSLLLMVDMGMETHLHSLVRYFDDQNIKVSLQFNGAAREVALTLSLPDILPPYQQRSLYVRSLTNSDLRWPAYIEKAFLICLGQHYAFNGSNMAQDTYMLTGWFPDVRKISEASRKELAMLWRLKEKGEVALGIGSGNMSDALASQLGVISTHDYVICAYNEDTSKMTLKNPWILHNSQGRDDMISERMLDVGLSLVGHFTYLYVNWKPNYQYSASATIFLSPPKWPSSYLGDLPQYEFCNTTDETQQVAILVEQFIDDSPQSPFCVSVFENQGKIFAESQVSLVAGGDFTNSRLEYFAFAAKPNVPYCVVVKMQGDTPLTFSLAVHHNIAEMTLTKAKVKYPHIEEEITGTWGFGSNGGNWSLASFVDNPQYDLRVDSVTSMLVVLRTTAKAYVNFHILHCDSSQIGRKLRNFDKSKILFDYKYENELQVQEVKHIEPGNYRLVVSASTQEDKGDFVLLVYNSGSKPLHLAKVPEALGTFMQKLQFEWNFSNRRKFSVTANHSQTNVTFRFCPNEQNSSPTAYRPALRASVFDSNGLPVVITNQWNDCIYGVFLDCTLPKAEHKYILLVERFETGSGICRLVVGSSGRVHMGEEV